MNGCPFCLKAAPLRQFNGSLQERGGSYAACDRYCRRPSCRVVFGCIITYKVGNRILVEGMGIKSAEFIMLVLYGAGVAAYFCCRPVGRWILLGVLLFWAVVQFFCHWYYFIFGASEKKLQSYHECFRDTVALFPQNKTRIVPDLYHVILHLLIICEMGLLIAELCKS